MQLAEHFMEISVQAVADRSTNADGGGINLTRILSVQHKALGRVLFFFKLIRLPHKAVSQATITFFLSY